MNYDNVLIAIREEIQAEHSLISQRLSWYVGSQSFLLTAYAIAWNKDHEWRMFFQQGMPILGALLSILAFIGVRSAIRVQKDLIAQQTDLLARLIKAQPDDADDKKILEEYRKTTCSGRPTAQRFHKLAMIAPWAVPLLFLLVWIFAYFGKFIH